MRLELQNKKKDHGWTKDFFSVKLKYSVILYQGSQIHLIPEYGYMKKYIRRMCQANRQTERKRERERESERAIPVIVKGNNTASMTIDEVAEVPIASWCDNTSEI